MFFFFFFFILEYAMNHVSSVDRKNRDIPSLLPRRTIISFSESPTILSTFEKFSKLLMTARYVTSEVYVERGVDFFIS